MISGTKTISNEEWLAEKPIRAEALEALRGTAFRDAGVKASVIIGNIAQAKGCSIEYIAEALVYAALSQMRQRGMVRKLTRRTGKYIFTKQFGKVEQSIVMWRLTNVGAGLLQRRQDIPGQVSRVPADHDSRHAAVSDPTTVETAPDRRHETDA